MSRLSPIGAEPLTDGTSFRVWALGRRSLSVVVEGMGEQQLEAEADGYFVGFVPGVGEGAKYRFRVDGAARLLADPASKWQPEGPQGPSVVCSVNRFGWTDADWRGVQAQGQVLYEMHIGTFTQAGDWAGAAEHLPWLRDLGITVVQMMPIGEFGGRFGWGYDMVLPFAPSHLYGAPDDLRRFIDRAHGLGIGVILDVVYNHVGIGENLRDFSGHYFTRGHENEWGEAFNFGGEGAGGVRQFVAENAAYWIRDFHFDGLRLDATQAMLDDGDDHIIAEIARTARAAAGERSIYLTAENHPQDRRLLDPPERGGYGLDALAGDDFHHAARVALTAHNDFYYSDYLGTPQEFVAAAKFGHLYQGQRSDMRNRPYGTNSFDVAPARFVHFLENHDQIANSARGLRMQGLASPARVRAMTALLLLSPHTPCLFQGQEFVASTPFFYFAGVDKDDAAGVIEGRIKGLSKFPGVSDPAMTAALTDPTDDKTFRASTLDWSEAASHAEAVALHRDLLVMRRSDAAFARQGEARRLDGAVLTDAAFLLRYFAENGEEDRLVMVNLGRDQPIGVIAEPLFAPPPGRKWVVIWSSEDPCYGGSGRRPVDTSACWVLPGNAALVFAGEALEGRS